MPNYLNNPQIAASPPWLGAITSPGAFFSLKNTSETRPAGRRKVVSSIRNCAVLMLLSVLLQFQVSIAAEANVGYIDYKMSLGENDNQLPLGSINIRLTSLGPDAYTPAALNFKSLPLSTEVEVMEDANKIRQVKASTGIVDVVPVGAAYEVRFYDRSAIGTKTTLYTINPGSIPYAIFSFNNPGDEKGEPRLEIRENRPKKPTKYTLFTHKNDRSWTMEKGAISEGQRVPDERMNLLKTVINNQPVKILTSDEFVGMSHAVTTVKCEYESNADPLYAKRLVYNNYPDGRREAYDYERGDYDSTTTPPIFTPSPEGAFMRTSLTLGRAVDKSPLVAFRSTRTATITGYTPHSAQDSQNVLLEVFSIYDGVEFKTVNSAAHQYDKDGHLIRTIKDGRTNYSAVWHGDYKVLETDEAGTTTARTYDVYYKYRDVPSRTDFISETKSIKIGVPAMGPLPAQLDVVTTFTAQDEGLKSSRSGDDASTMTTGNFDQISALNGIDIVPEYLTEGVNPDGSTWVRIDYGSIISKTYQITTTDRLGRIARLERFSPNGAVMHEYLYNSRGQLKRERRTGSPDRLFEYGDFGELYRTGLDFKGTGTLDLSIDGSVQQTEMRYAQEQGIWYQLEIESSCSRGELRTTSMTKKRLTLPPEMLRQTIFIDGEGRSTTQTTLVDRSKALVVEIIDPPAPGRPATRIIRNNMVQAEQLQPEQLITPDAPLSEEVDPWSKFVWDTEHVLQLPYITPQPSLTPEENRVFCEASIRLINDSEIVELNRQLQTLHQAQKTRMAEKLIQINPEAAKFHAEVMDRQSNRKSQTTSGQFRPRAEMHAQLRQALRMVNSDTELIDLRKEIKIISEQRDELAEAKLEEINPAAGILYRQIKEGFKNARPKQ